MLSQSLINRLPPAEAFGLNDLLNVVEEEKQRLGLIIDLTFTTRYYNPEVRITLDWKVCWSSRSRKFLLSLMYIICHLTTDTSTTANNDIHFQKADN